MPQIAAGPTFTVNALADTIAAVETIIQITAASAVPLWVIRARISQFGSTSSAQARISILRKTAAATVTAFTPLGLNPNDTASATAGINATAEGTDGAVLIDAAFNVLAGWEWIATPQDQIFVPASGIIALKFPVAPASEAWSAQVVFIEAK